MKGDILDGCVFWSFLAVVALAPLPYGAVHLWSAGLLSLLVGLVLAAWAVLALVRPGTSAIGVRHYAVPAIPFAAALAWIGLQACPAVPSGLAHPLWAEAAAALGTTPSPTVSLAPDATLMGLMRIGTYAAVFWLAMQLCADWRRASTAFWALSAAAFAYAVYGLWAYFTAPGTILFATKWAYQHSLTSTLVNRGHYALYAGLGLVVSFGMMIRYARRDASGAFDNSIRFLHALENLRLPVFLFLANIVLLVTAMLLAQSRGGIAFAAIAVVSLVLMLTGGDGGGRRRSAALVLAGMAVGGIVLFLISGEKFLIRLGTAEDTGGGRAEVYALTLRAIAGAPFAGHGLGSFPALFHLYRGADFSPISTVYTEAHNVYLEFAAEAGLIAAALYFAALAWIAGTCMHAARRMRHHGVFPAVAGAAAVLAGLHALFDFGVQIPGIAVTFAALMGIGYGQARAANP